MTHGSGDARHLPHVRRQPDVTWTKHADLLLADVQGANLKDLHTWWNEYG